MYITDKKIRVWDIQEITQNQQEKDKQYNKMDQKEEKWEKSGAISLERKRKPENI